VYVDVGDSDATVARRSEWTTKWRAMLTRMRIAAERRPTASTRRRPRDVLFESLVHLYAHEVRAACGARRVLTRSMMVSSYAPTPYPPKTAAHGGGDPRAV